jgi:PAS domain-containing protein
VWNPGSTLARNHVARESGHVPGPSELKERFQAAAQRQGEILSAVSDGVLTVNGRGLVDGINGPAERLTLWPRDEARGQPAHHVAPLIDEETRTIIAPAVGEGASDEGNGSRRPALLVRRDGSTLPTTSRRASPIRPGSVRASRS